MQRTSCNKKGKRLRILIDFLENKEQFNLVESLINLKSDRFITHDCKKEISELQPLPIDLKGFSVFTKENGIYQQIKIDLDFNGDIRHFNEPFLLTNKQKNASTI